MNIIYLLGQECLLDRPLSDEDISTLNDHTSLIVLEGYFRYQDVFGQKFKKHFSTYTFGKDNTFYPAALDILNEEVKDEVSTSPR